MSATVQQVIEALMKLGKPDAKVWLQGCDCWGAADGTVVVTADGDVVIAREAEAEWAPEVGSDGGWSP